MKQIQKLLLVLFSVLMLSQNIVAGEKIELKNSFLNLISEVVLVTLNTSLSKEQRNNNILDILTPSFDFKLMAKLSLGKNAWNSLTSEEKVNFTNLYVARMKKSYSEKLDSNSDGKVEIKSIKQVKKNRIFIVTNFIGNDDKMEIIYKFHKPRKEIADKNRWLIYDVEILGVSILKTDKSQFREFLQTKSITDLMNELAK